MKLSLYSLCLPPVSGLMASQDYIIAKLLTCGLPIYLYLCSMNFFRIAFELFALYILYKLIFDFIIPVAKTTRQVKKQFEDMSRQTQEQMNRQQSNQQNSSYSANSPTPAGSRKDDYIDFEEVK